MMRSALRPRFELRRERLAVLLFILLARTIGKEQQQLSVPWHPRAL
jgi:hypothetical protein